MTSVFKRSGVAVCEIAEALEWKPDWFIQVGVGMRYDELSVMMKAWDLKDIVGFEASPTTCKHIRDDYPGTLVEVAVSDVADDVVVFYEKVKHMNGSSMYPMMVEQKTKVRKVKTNTLDNMLCNPCMYDTSKEFLLWIDCEGNELKVLKGAEEVVKYVDMINIEMTMSHARVGWCDSVEVHQWLMEHGFYLQWTHTQRMSDGQYDGVYVTSKLFNPELCCCPYTVSEWRKCRTDK